MKIVQLLSGINTAITNEEQRFLNTHRDHVKLHSLDERDHWMAQNLVRKGLYAISNDNNTLVKNLNDTNSR
jgi:hypothetical protein